MNNECGRVRERERERKRGQVIVRIEFFSFRFVKTCQRTALNLNYTWRHRFGFRQASKACARKFNRNAMIFDLRQAIKSARRWNGKEGEQRRGEWWQRTRKNYLYSILFRCLSFSKGFLLQLLSFSIKTSTRKCLWFPKNLASNQILGNDQLFSFALFSRIL